MLTTEHTGVCHNPSLQPVGKCIVFLFSLEYRVPYWELVRSQLPEDWRQLLRQLKQPALWPPGQHVPHQDAHNSQPYAPKGHQQTSHDWRCYETGQVYPAHACVHTLQVTVMAITKSWQTAS